MTLETLSSPPVLVAEDHRCHQTHPWAATTTTTTALPARPSARTRTRNRNPQPGHLAGHLHVACGTYLLTYLLTHSLTHLLTCLPRRPIRNLLPLQLPLGSSSLDDTTTQQTPSTLPPPLFSSSFFPSFLFQSVPGTCHRTCSITISDSQPATTSSPSKEARRVLYVNGRPPRYTE